MQRYIVNLDLPPQDRWREIINHYKRDILHVATSMEELFGNGVMSTLTTWFFSGLTKMGGVMYSQEIESISEMLGLPVGKVALMQIAYEFFAACTSIIAQDDDIPFLIRNMDWDMEMLKPLTIEVEFYKKGRAQFIATTWAGYVGILTGMRYKSFGVAINYRRVGGSVLTNLLQGIQSAWPISFLVRHVLETCKTYPSAVLAFQRAALMAPTYVIICGVNVGEG